MKDIKVILDKYNHYAYISPFKDIDFEHIEIFLDSIH